MNNNRSHLHNQASGIITAAAAVFTTSQPSACLQDRVFGVFGERRNRGLELSVFGNPVRAPRLPGGLP